MRRSRAGVLAVTSMVLAAALAAMATAAELPLGTKAVTLITASGERQDIGKVTFAPDGDGTRIEVEVDAPQFRDEFLSMRPFRCLPDDKELWCHLAYPYATRRRVTVDDLADLEYALLFLYKPPAGYGIDAWNGLYFELSLGTGGVISGDVNEIDLNVLAVPPEGKFPRPITHEALTRAEPSTHRFARIEIR